MFYTVTLPCTLWFLERRKAGTERADKVLFFDAQYMYRQVDRAHRDWNEAQLAFMACVVRLHRGEPIDLGEYGDEARAKVQEYFGSEPKYADVAGFCRSVSIGELETHDWSLNPGRYVGVAPGEEVGDEDFRERLQAWPKTSKA